MAETDLQAYQRRVRAMVEEEVATLEQLRARFSAEENPATRAMADVCKWTQERVQLLGVRIRFLEHTPRGEEARRG